MLNLSFNHRKKLVSVLLPFQWHPEDLEKSCTGVQGRPRRPSGAYCPNSGSDYTFASVCSSLRPLWALNPRQTPSENTRGQIVFSCLDLVSRIRIVSRLSGSALSMSSGCYWFISILTALFQLQLEQRWHGQRNRYKRLCWMSCHSHRVRWSVEILRDQYRHVLADSEAASKH